MGDRAKVQIKSRHQRSKCDLIEISPVIRLHWIGAHVEDILRELRDCMAADHYHFDVTAVAARFVHIAGNRDESRHGIRIISVDHVLTRDESPGDNGCWVVDITKPEWQVLVMDHDGPVREFVIEESTDPAARKRTPKVPLEAKAHERGRVAQAATVEEYPGQIERLRTEAADWKKSSKLHHRRVEELRAKLAARGELLEEARRQRHANHERAKAAEQAVEEVRAELARVEGLYRQCMTERDEAREAVVLAQQDADKTNTAAGQYRQERDNALAREAKVIEDRDLLEDRLARLIAACDSMPRSKALPKLAELEKENDRLRDKMEKASKTRTRAWMDTVERLEKERDEARRTRDELRAKLAQANAADTGEPEKGAPA